jgi:lipopolysaccharide/colanic/teichoic acid biosynthesis glycosyltransferase
LRGEMSLVGPRPFPHYHLEQFNPVFRSMRRSVMPGMTGLWQVEARSDSDLAVQEALDSYYIQNWSIWMDLVLLARTVSVVFSGKGAY